MKCIKQAIKKWVCKDRNFAAGQNISDINQFYGQYEFEELKKTIQAEPRRFISQEVIDFQDLDIVDGKEVVARKADLRAFVLAGETIRVWPSGLTRFSRNPDSFVVNSSQGGGFKDTWILSH